MKVCRDCKQELPESAFYLIKKTGLPESYCKLCRRSKNIAYWARKGQLINKKVRQKYHSEYYSENRKARLAKMKAYYEANKESYKEKYRVSDKEASKKRWRVRYWENIDVAREKSKPRSKLYREKLPDAYIRNLMVKRATGIPKEAIPISLIDAKRIHLQITKFIQRKNDENG